MLALIKGNALFVFYLIGLAAILLSLRGKVYWAVCFLTALIPLRNVVDRLQQMPLGKDFIDIILLFMIIGWLISSGGRHKVFNKCPVNKFAVIIIVYMFFSLLQGSAYLKLPQMFSLADDRVQDWKNFVVMPVLFFITLNTVRDKVWVWRIVFVMCVTLVLMDYYLAQQIRWYTNLISRKKISGTFVFLGPNEVAAFYNMYTMILISLFFTVKKKLMKFALGGVIYANIFCILFLFSRAAYLGTAVGLFILLFFRNKKLLVPLILVALCWQAVLPAKVLERISQTTNDFGELDESAQGRLDIWESSLELFSDNPITGTGFGTFRYMGFGLQDTHNIYLKILAEQGALGLIVFLLLVIAMFFQGIRLFKRGDDEPSRALGLGFATCVVVLVLNNFFGDRWSYMEVGTWLWVFAGLVGRLNIIADETWSERDPQQRARRQLMQSATGMKESPVKLPGKRGIAHKKYSGFSPKKKGPKRGL